MVPPVGSRRWALCWPCPRDAVTGPLAGVRVVELAAQGPAPFGCMLLADLGAEVITVERVGAPSAPVDAHSRGRVPIALNLKDRRAVEVVLQLVARADAFVEGFRPGVVERLGLGPVECLAANPRLVYARMTGWGQTGPLALSAGHDINYLAVSGALHAIGSAGGPPVPPLNLLGDYGAGGFPLALGIVSGVLAARSSGAGQVLDVAMVDALAAVLAPLHAMSARGAWSGERGTNILDGGAPFYGVYPTKDGRWVAVGAIERPFYEALLRGLGIEPGELGERLDRAAWAQARQRLAEVFLTRSRDEWVAHFEGQDVCLSPVLDLAEAAAHPHAVSRDTLRTVDGVPHQAAVPRFSDGTSEFGEPCTQDPASEVLGRLGVSPELLDELRSAGVAG